jgi:sugar diacid utilization regulator
VSRIKVPALEVMLDLVRRMNAAVRAEVAAYAAGLPPGFDADLGAVDLQTVQVYFRSLAEDRPPDNAELEFLDTAMRRRFHQGFALEDIQHNWRVEIRVLWGFALELYPSLDLARAGLLTLECADRMAGVAAKAYVDERELSFHSREIATSLFFARLLEAPPEDAAALEHEGVGLGFDLTRPNIAVLIGPVSPTADSDSAVDDIRMSQAARRLRARFPFSPSLLVPSGLLLVVPKASVADLAAAARSVMESYQGAPRLVVGLGTPRIGASGLVSTFHEATRARALGGIIDPDGQVFRYDEVRLWDLFKEGDSVPAFISEVLDSVLKYDHNHHTQLIETLDIFFTVAANRKETARRLGIHPNTVDYRIDQIEKLLGAKIRSKQASFRVQLALKLLPLSMASPSKARSS